MLFLIRAGISKEPSVGFPLLNASWLSIVRARSNEFAFMIDVRRRFCSLAMYISVFGRNGAVVVLMFRAPWVERPATEGETDRDAGEAGS